MITKAQLDSAMRDLEARMGKSIDLKLEARIIALEKELAGLKQGEGEKREAAEEDIFGELEAALHKLRQECRANAKRSDNIEARLEALERILADDAGSGSKSGADADVITDDFSS